MKCGGKPCLCVWVIVCMFGFMHPDVCVRIGYMNAVGVCVCNVASGLQRGYCRGNSPKGRDPQPKGKHASPLPLIFALHATDTHKHIKLHLLTTAAQTHSTQACAHILVYSYIYSIQPSTLAL